MHFFHLGHYIYIRRLFVMDGIRFVMVKTVCPALVLFFVVSFSVCNFGCRNSIEEIEVLEGDFSVPQIENFAVTGASTLEIGFSKKTVVQNLAVVSKTTESEFCDITAEYDEETQKTVVALGSQTEVGEDYLIEGQVEDLHGNSLTFSIGFKGFNENPARVILSEVRNAYGTASVKDEEGVSRSVHRSEYVELYVLKGGNLCGIEICSASDGSEKKYTMPSIDVETGEYITVHMRTVNAEGIDGEGMISETADDFTLSTHEDSCDSARDLWSDNTKSCFADSDIVYVQNVYDGTILDALVFAKSSVGEWKESFSGIVAAVEQSGVWGSSASPENAVCSDFITTSAATRSYSRQNIDDAIAAYAAGEPIVNGKDVWMITANTGSGKKFVAGITPGMKNSSNEYKK